ncbi:uncharacterized protein [Setaria viridis]|uniref:Uncharacterized protein n=1 Tax=Setaria viridis TaxID=4556 RepID=A0A4U6VCY6_SETVI|nr:uncharacterized protein LOC117850565 [Setaria viridis]TKW25723.1 hypothetical protein SEVIR_3G136700v2 [Setaria viridis]
MGKATGQAQPRKERPPPKESMVLVPPLFDYPPIAARTRMSVPAYEVMFGKLSLQNLFEDYFDQSGNMTSRILLKADPHADLIATVSAAADKKCGNVKGDALFHWQKESDDPHTFVNLLVSTSNPMWQLRSSAYYPEYGIGAFGTLQLMGNRVRSEECGVVGLRYGSESISLGASFVPFPLSGVVPYGAWLVGRKGNLSAGVQYKPLSGNKNTMPFTDPENWNCAISYSVGSTSPLSPLSTFTLELARSKQLTTSFYQHMVVQRGVKNPSEDKEVVEITNYIDFGLEFTGRIDKDKPENDNSLFQLAASWQVNKNFLLKGKLGPSKSSVVLALKSWWRPSFTFSITAVNDHSKGTTSFGFGIRTEDLRQPSYQRADPNYIMLTPNMEHSSQGAGERPVFQACSGSYDHLPTDLRPIDRIM